MRKIYAGKRDALVAALDEHAPDVRLSGLAAGFHAVAQLASGASEAAVVEAAQARGVGIYLEYSSPADDLGFWGCRSMERCP